MTNGGSSPPAPPCCVVWAPQGLAASKANGSNRNAELKPMRYAFTRPRMRPPLLTGNTLRPVGEQSPRHRDLFGRPTCCLSPPAANERRRFFSRRHTPADAVACDYCLVAGFLARGSSSLYRLPRKQLPSGVHGRDSPPTVAGAATALCSEAHGPRSLLAPCGDHRAQSWHLLLMKVKEHVDAAREACSGVSFKHHFAGLFSAARTAPSIPLFRRKTTS